MKSVLGLNNEFGESIIALARENNGNVFQNLKDSTSSFGNTLLGFAALALLNLTEPVTGIALGVNALNALVIGILGVPGLGLLLLVQWLFT